ncbi:dephospho-CoA kinase [Undibacterium fentianense]|uniref:Dephospho-CoA kinase n=1 Tax=Undibacterium fentianense TaxID=2828728 RepID=A0A941DYD2_9BURK|nr:dephospho-CoA kinase [Undibacterium fentianense]MBR7799719.1 dephospho-CoA kinase [Undibacterium fentianense]
MSFDGTQQFYIGLTGGIGSGKSTVAQYFAELGVSIVDTDVIAHALTAPGGEAIEPIRMQFGADFISADGSMDRKKMRELIFTNPEAKQTLEQILHPRIRTACETAARHAEGSYVMFVVPLLVESGNWIDRVKRILVVDCDEEIQIQRVIARNHFSREQVEGIMRAQASRAFRLRHADDVVNANLNLLEVARQVEALHQKYLKMCV